MSNGSMRCHRRAAESDWRPGSPLEVGKGNVQAIHSRRGIPHRAQGRDQRQTDHDEAGACAGFGELSPLTDLRTPHNWSSQDSVETLSARLVSRFELRWTHPAEMTVAPHSIVEGIDVVGHIGDRQLSALVDLFLDPLFLQAAEEGLGDGIVPAVAFRLILGSRRFERQNRRHASLPYWVP